MIDITGLDKAAVLCALVNQGNPVGMGAFHYKKITREEANRFLSAAGGQHIDYAFGVPIKARIAGDTFEERLYDRDQGAGAAARAIAALRGA